MNRNNAGYVLHARYGGNLSVSVNSTQTNFNQTSDYRLKENIVNLDGAITRVKQLTPRRFNFIIEPDDTIDGFVAHEAATVVPDYCITKSMMMVILFIRVLIMANLCHY